MSETRQLVAAVLDIEVEDLEAEDLAAVGSLVLDHLGVVARGAQEESAATFRRFAESFDHQNGPRIPMIGTREHGPPLPAAMANAVAGHSIEYDDVHNGASLHPGVAVIPTVTAATILASGDDDDFVRGVVVGYEVMCRVGRAANPPAHYRRHFHPTGTAGALGAAAGAGAALGLDVDEVTSAVGIAASTASGSMQFLRDGAWTKRLHPALAARNGLESALLAREGFVGTEDGIAGDRGFLAGYSDDPQPELLLRGWGDMPLEVRNTSIKAHTCCRYNQGPVDALLKLREEHGFDGGSVAAVTIGVPTVAVDIVAEPADAKRRPQSVVDAQFSLHYAAAVALVHGRAGLDEYAESMIGAPELEAVMDSVGYEVDPEIDAAYPEQWRAWVRVETTEGQTFEARVDDPKGDPANPLTADELSGKFRALTDGVFDPATQREVEHFALTIGESGTFEKLLAKLG